MSTSRGNWARNRPQKHQNRTVFKNDLHDTSHQTKLLNSLNISGVCKRCKDIIDWKIKYKKYKLLSAPKKCVGCEQKTVKYNYHALCTKCAREKNVCAKCLKAVEVVSEAPVESQDTADLTTMLKTLPERKRRTILSSCTTVISGNSSVPSYATAMENVPEKKYINKQQEGEGDQKITSEMISQIDDMLAKMKKVNFDDDDNSEFDCSGDEKSDSNDEK